MARCGRSGCPCTTCEECGIDYPCNCELNKRTDEIFKRLVSSNPADEVHEQELIELLQDWRWR